MRTIILALCTCISVASVAQVSEKRDLSEFTAIRTSGFVDVQLKPGSEWAVEIKATGKEDLKQVKTTVDGGELDIDAKIDSDKQEDKPRLTVYYKEGTTFIRLQSTGKSKIVGHQHQLKGKLIELIVRAGGHIHLDLDYDEIEASVTAGGSINLKGAAERFDASVTSGGSIGAYRVDAKDIKARVKAGGDIMCQPLEEFDARVTTGGTIYYLGEPTGKVKTKTALGGDIIYREETDIVR